MSLTTTAKNTKIAFALFVVLVIVYLSGKMFFLPIMKNAWVAIFPPKNPPNPIYGRLEAIEFVPQTISRSRSPKYTLFTSDGKLPSDLPSRMTVYKYEPPPFSYEAGKDATRTAEKLGFSSGDLITNLKGEEYKWRNPSINSTLTIQINSKALELETSESSLTNVYEEGSINKSTAMGIAKSHLESIGRFSDTLYQRGWQTVVLGTVENRNIEFTSYAGEAEIGFVNFFRAIKDFPLVGPTYHLGNIRMYVAQIKDKKQSQIYAHPYIYYNVRSISPQSNATYPLLPVSNAWSEVAKGNGVISSVEPNDLNPFEKYRPVTINEILISEIFLAYYDDVEKQNYLQPIYVFKGNYIGSGEDKGKIAIYYPALSAEYIKSVQNENQ